MAAVSCFAACGSDRADEEGAGSAVTTGESALVVSFGSDVLPDVRHRLEELLQRSSPLPVRTLSSDALPPALGEGAFVMSFGDTAATRALVEKGRLGRLGPEGFVVESGTLAGAPALAAVGNAPAKATADHGNLGTAYAAYAALEELGFGFLHPLAPTIPARFAVPAKPIHLAESPAWRVRGIHLHTMHPLELTDVLQGWGKLGPQDEAGWTAGLAEWDRYLEWLVANRQNRVEWVLLWAGHWSEFADSPIRQKRLTTLVEHAHAHGIAAGVDAALALQQQYMFRLVRRPGELEDEKQQIRERLDWLFGAGFDFFSTESGSTEFTHPEPSRMLAWMNEATDYAATKHGAPSYIKAHCSTGQVADGFSDPVTGQPINFNFLPHYADKRLGVMPHTVEIYGFHDPAPTYGNKDFSYMLDFLQQEVGQREVLWHPETAYWVTYDIDVPLFLPVYAQRRVDDLRILAGTEKGRRMDGQMIFSSGWEWGYWLNDVVTARAAWNPQKDAPNTREALVRVLAPVARVLGPDFVTWIADTADRQFDSLVLGKVKGVAPADVVKRNGMAYLEGFDATADLAMLGKSLGVAFAPVTQPNRLGLVDMRNPLHGGPSYSREIEPLLAEMESSFGALASRGDELARKVSPEAADLASDLADAARMTALRAEQVHGLYDYVDGWPGLPWAQGPRRARLEAARDALDAALGVVQNREKHYRVEADRIAGWRPNPTAYDFTYLWFVRSLYFWWRDEGKAVDAPISPCYLNVMNPANIALGDGTVADVAAAIRKVVQGGVGECLAAPQSEPTFPQDGLRSRP
jgi:hypothetical protein